MWFIHLFDEPSIEEISQYSTPGTNDETLYLAIEEQAEIGLRVGSSGNLLFFNIENGEAILGK